MNRTLSARFCVIACLLALAFMAPLAAHAASVSRRVYAVPIVDIEGRGITTFHAVFGFLVNAAGNPVGVYRTYPSKGSRSLSEMYSNELLASKAGAVLASYRETPLLVLRGMLRADSDHQSLTLSWLANRMTERYATADLRFTRSGAERWSLDDPHGVVARTLVVNAETSGITSIGFTPWPTVRPRPTWLQNVTAEPRRGLAR